MILENEVLESFNKMLPYLSCLFDNEASFGITNRTEYLVVQNCESLHLKIKAGDLIPEGGAVYQALKTGQTLITDVPKEVYGIPFKSYAIPVKNSDNKVIGVIVVGKTLEKRNEVLALSETISSSLKQIFSALQNVSEGVKNIVDSNTDILDEVKIAYESTKGTDDILKFVQNVSKQTNLLGLNASIEASKVGDLGRGFSVIAKEIRKLSNSSSESVKKIDDVLRKIEGSVSNISTKVSESSLFFETQASNFAQITTSVQDLSTSAHYLESLSRKL